MTIADLPNIGEEGACFLISGFIGFREVLSCLDSVEWSIASCRLMARLTLKFWRLVQVLRKGGKVRQNVSLIIDSPLQVGILGTNNYFNTTIITAPGDADDKGHYPHMRYTKSTMTNGSDDASRTVWALGMVFIYTSVTCFITNQILFVLIRFLPQ